MALRLTEGWESYGSTTSGAINPDAKWVRTGSIGTTRVPGRFGGVALQLSGSSEAIGQALLFDPEPQTIIVGFALKIIDSTSAQPVFEARINTNQRTRITVNTDRTLSISRGNAAAVATGSTVLALNTWYYIELKTFVADSGNGAGQGTYHLKIDGATEVSGTASMVPSGRNGVNLVTFNGGGSFGVTALQIDDVYICDDQGSINNDFLGDVRIETLFPNGDDTATWTPSTGSDHYSLVDETPADGASTYVETASAAAYDIFDYPSFGSTGTIHGVVINSVASGNTSTYKNVAKSGATVSDSTRTFTNTSGYLTGWSPVQVDPDTSLQWTDSGFASAKFGVKRVAGTPRLTQQFIEILYTYEDPGTEFEREVTSEIEFSDDVEVEHFDFGLEIESEINFEHTVSLTGEYNLEIETEISFIDRAYKTLPEAIESELVLDHEAITTQFVYTRFIPEGMYDGSIFDRTNIPYFSEDLLNLVHSVVSGGTVNKSASSAMTLNHSVGVSQSVINREISSILSFSDQVGRVYEETAASVLTLQSKIERTYFEETLLSLGHEIEAYVGRNVSNQLVLNHVLEQAGLWSRNLQSDLEINHSVMWFVDRLAQTCKYSPQGNFIVPTMPTLSHGTLTLSYPFLDPTQTLILRNAEFGNTINLNFQRVKTNTRGGALLIFADDEWPQQKTMRLTVTSLSESKINSLKTFLSDSLGKEIKLTDHYSRNWKGIITTPDCDITHEGPCRYTVSFEFEGEISDLPPP